jgi:ATP-binding cassette subfamily B protein
MLFRPVPLVSRGGIASIAVSLAFGLLVPYLVGLAIDDLGQGVTWEKVVYYPLIILGANLMSGIFLFSQRRLLINTSRHIEFDMRNDFYAALVPQPLEFFHNNRIGDLMARATNDLAAIRQIVGPMILYSCQAIFALIIVLPILLNISVKLTVLLLIPMPLVSLTVKYLGGQIHVRFEKIQGILFRHHCSRTGESHRACASSARTRRKMPRSHNLKNSIANTPNKTCGS